MCNGVRAVVLYNCMVSTRRHTDDTLGTPVGITARPGNLQSAARPTN